jgi:fibronectin-binding autotransporter adhesin
VSVPTNLIPTLITGLQEYTGSSTLGYMPYILEGRTYKVQFANIAAVGAVPSTRVIAAGTGLAGGGDLSENRVISIAPGGVGFDQLALSGVVAGTYGSGSAIPILTVDAKGRVTSATTAALDVTGFVPTSRTITAGDGLTGGGSLASNVTLAANFSAATPSALGVASAGTANTVSRGDHVHPAVNLSDTTQTQGALPLGRGGTGDALSPVAGAVVYSTGSKFALTNPGVAGQVLVSNGTDEPQWQTIAGAGTVTSVNLTAGTGISVSGGPITSSGSINVVNTAPDQIVSLTGAGLTTITGTYPNFTISSSGGTGTVTSVSGTGAVSGLSLSGTVTSAGSLTLGGTLVVTPSNFASQTANTVLAAPNGSAGVPTFRAIVAADIPTLNQNTTGTASNVTGVVAVANGGTGASIAATARSNLSAAASGANTDITSIALTTGTISAAPASGTDIVNKLYADSIASGINFHQSVRLATTAALPANTYNNGTSGVGATLTANANGALTVDGVAAVVGNRILVKNEVTQANNGVYTVTQVGSGAAPYILTRATDFDSSGSGVDQIDAGDFFLVTAGSTQSNTSWVQQTPLPIVVGTTAIVFSQFAAPVLYSAGTGLTLAGTVFSITNTGVAASTYGSASSVPVIAFNAQGQATSVTNTSIAISGSQITSGSVAVAQGGTGATNAATALTNLGAYPASNPNGYTSNTGTVTSVSGTGTVNGITLTGSITTSGSLTLGGTLSGVSLTSQVTGTLPVANGGTGATTLTANNVLLGNGTSAVQVVAPGTSGNVLTSNGTTWVSSAAAGGSVSYPQNIQSGNYTLVLSDAGKHIYSANTAVQTITIPTNASVAFPIGTLITVVNFGTNAITFSVAGVSVYQNGSKSASASPKISPGTSLQLLKTDTNAWNILLGALSTSTTASYLIVAGGASGGSNDTNMGTGGGGAGGLLTGTSTLAFGTTYTITVGAGGAVQSGNGNGNSGSNSSALSVTASGGGGGSGVGSGAGVAGGSGGGGSGTFAAGTTAGGSGTGGQGNAGGAGQNSTVDADAQVGGGGGGASAVGSAGTGVSGGNGGAGTASSITGSSVTYAGGGGGGKRTSGTAGTGGAGGGGNGGAAGNGSAGTANTGGGGGGAGTGGGGTVRTGGAGGSGVVILSIPTSDYTGTTTGSPTVTTSGSNTILTFTSSGSYTA